MVGILIYDQDYCCLEPPAKINVHRKKNGGGKTQFLLNDRVIGELRNEEVSVFSTEAVNVVSKRTNRDTDSRKVKCAVRPGETVMVYFCGYTVLSSREEYCCKDLIINSGRLRGKQGIAKVWMTRKHIAEFRR